MDLITLGNVLRTNRKKKHLTQRELASRLGLSRNSVYMWEKDRTVPSMYVLEKLSGILGVSVRDMLKVAARRKEKRMV